MRGSEPVMWANRPQIGRVSGGARAVRRRRAEQAHFRHPTPQSRKRALTEEEEGGASDDEPWSDLLMHSRRSRTLWLKLACELDADVLIPGAPHATSLYTSSKAEQACMWAWWANAWSSNCAYSVSEMRSMYTWQTSLRGGARCSKRARLAPTSSVNSSITAEGGSVLDALRRMSPARDDAGRRGELGCGPLCEVEGTHSSGWKQQALSVPSSLRSPRPLLPQTPCTTVAHGRTRARVPVRMPPCEHASGAAPQRSARPPAKSERPCRVGQCGSGADVRAHREQEGSKHSGVHDAAKRLAYDDNAEREGWREMGAEVARLCRQLREETEAAEVYPLMQDDPLCLEAWDARPLAFGRYGSVNPLENLPVSRSWMGEKRKGAYCVKIFNALRTNARRQRLHDSVPLLWVRPLKELFHLMMVRDVPYVCKVMGFVLLPADSPSPATERAHPSTKCPPEVASCSCTGGDGAKAVWCGDACGEVAAGVDGVVADMVAAVSCCVVGDAQHVATTTGQEQDRIDGMRLSGVKGNGKAQEATGPETLDVPLKITGIVLEWLGGGWVTIEEACSGETLRNRVRLARDGGAEASLLAGEVVAHVVHLLRGLAAIHQRGLAHRDIKPSNIMVYCGHASEACGNLDTVLKLGGVTAKYLDLGNAKDIREEREGRSVDGWGLGAYQELFSRVEFEGTRFSRGGVDMALGDEERVMLTRVAFGKRKDRHENRFLDRSVWPQSEGGRVRGGGCVYINPKALDEYALGVVIFEYVASLAAGLPVMRSDREEGQCFWQSVPRSRRGVDLGEGRNGTGWSACRRWQNVVRWLCAVEIQERRSLQAVLESVERDAAMLCLELCRTWAAG